VKDEGVNLNTLTMYLTSIVPCVPFMLFHICHYFYGHAMFKCCYYAINDLKMSYGMKEISIKEV
jgi:hypothetical protein